MAFNIDDAFEKIKEAFAEVDDMKRTGSGQRFNNLDDLWSRLSIFSNRNK